MNKIVCDDALNYLTEMDGDCVHLTCTSPPYYNAREYSQWKDIKDYLDDMREIIKETFRVLDLSLIHI